MTGESGGHETACEEGMTMVVVTTRWALQEK